MPDYVCAIASAYKAGHFTDFELTLLRQLGKADASIVQRQGHDKEILAVLGLVATGSGMAGANLLHEKAPRLFPAKTKLYEENRRSGARPCSNETCPACLELRSAMRTTREPVSCEPVSSSSEAARTSASKLTDERLRFEVCAAAASCTASCAKLLFWCLSQTLSIVESTLQSSRRVLL